MPTKFTYLLAPLIWQARAQHCPCWLHSCVNSSEPATACQQYCIEHAIEQGPLCYANMCLSQVVKHVCQSNADWPICQQLALKAPCCFACARSPTAPHPCWRLPYVHGYALAQTGLCACCGPSQGSSTNQTPTLVLLRTRPAFTQPHAPTCLARQGVPRAGKVKVPELLAQLNGLADYALLGVVVPHLQPNNTEPNGVSKCCWNRGSMDMCSSTSSSNASIRTLRLLLPGPQPICLQIRRHIPCVNNISRGAAAVLLVRSHQHRPQVRTHSLHC
jgi:hypothetical protein